MSNAYNADIPYNRLRRSESNVRRTGLKLQKYQDGVKRLAASILATHKRTGRGLLQNLVVHVNGDFMDVTAGGRRYDAIGLLIGNGDFEPDYPTSCLVIGADSATSASLTENTEREAMHPADEYDAFMQLNIVEGWSIDRIADEFGVSKLVVERRLKLRSAAPALLDDFREGKLTTDQLIALCSTDNHALQIEVWNRVCEQNFGSSPFQLRKAVISTEVDESDDRVAFIGGVEAYEKAGGLLRRDLFSQGGASAILADSALLDSLVDKKLQDHADELNTEGWGWVEVWPKMDHTAFDRLGRAPTQKLELTEDDAAKLLVLEQTLAQLNTQISSTPDEVVCEELSEQHDTLVEEIERLEASQKGYSSAVRQHAGAIMYYSYGNVRIERGLVRTSDRENLIAVLDEGQRVSGGRETESAGRKADAMSDALRRSLLSYRNLAAQRATASNPKAAKVLLICKFVAESRQLRNAAPTDMCITSGYGTRTDCTITDDEGKVKEAAFTEMGAALIEHLPQDLDALWDALVTMKDADLDKLLAFTIARSVSLSFELDGLSAKLVQTLEIDMADHFEPTAANYLGRVPKDFVIQALRDVDRINGDQDRDALLAMKKGQLAKEAESRLAGTRWVPELIRSQADKPQSKKRAAKGAPKSA